MTTNSLSRLFSIGGRKTRLAQSNENIETQLRQICACPADRGNSHISEDRMQQIHTLLAIGDERSGRGDDKGWRWRPRIFSILLNINGLQFMDYFIREGFNDFHLPFDHHTLPQFVSSDEAADFRSLFIQTQDYFLTSVKDFETGKSRHLYFRPTGEAFFGTIRYLGRGGFG